MIDDLYSQAVLKRAAQIGHLGHLDTPMATATRTARLCGSTLSVELDVVDGVITRFAQAVEACALGQAAAGILSQAVIGAPVAEVVAARDALRARLKGAEGADYPARFADFAILDGVRDFPARHASTLLALEATVDAALRVDKAISAE